MSPSIRRWSGVFVVACLAFAVAWQAFGQQGGAGGAGGAGAGGAGTAGARGQAGGAGGAGGYGGFGAGGRGGAGGSMGGMMMGGFPGAVSATNEYVYVLHNDTLYQFAANDLVLVNQVGLVPAPQKGNATSRTESKQK